MYFDSSKTVDFCAKHKLTLDQLLLCTLIYREQFANVYKYGKEVRSYKVADLKDLVSKGILTSIATDGAIKIDTLALTDKFTKLIGLSFNTLALDIWNLYPNQVVVGNKSFKGRNTSLESLENMLNEKIVRGSVRISDFPIILDSLRSQMANNNLGMALKNWVETEQWINDNEVIAEHGEDL